MASVETGVETADGAGAGRFRVEVLGPFRVLVDGVRASLPKSRKTRALLAYLALAKGPVRRERLCELLWDVPDDPRASLRWSLSKLRPIVNTGGVERLAATPDAVAWTGAAGDVDLHELERALGPGADHLSTAQLSSLAALFRGELAEGVDLPEHDAFQRWLSAERERVRAARARLLRPLLDRLEGSPADALAHAVALVEIEPYDERAHARLVGLHRRLGREKEAAAAYEAGVRTLGEIGRSAAALDAALRDGSAGRAARPPAHAAAAPSAADRPLTQDIRFCRSGDGTRIAYAVVGQGPPILKTANWLNHLEHDWESPVWRHAFRAFARERTLVRYDARGNGLSDWDADDLTLDAQVADLEAVADAAGLDRFPLLAMSQGCVVAVEYAVRHPERVSRLVLYGGYVRGWAVGAAPDAIAEREAELTLMRTGWGRDNPAFRQVFTSLFIPGGTPEQMDWLNELQRLTTTGGTAARIMRAFSTADVAHRLAQVRQPTLVLHAREDERVALARGRELAAGIPGARFVLLDSRNHLLLEHDPAWPRFWDEVSRFLAEEAR